MWRHFDGSSVTKVGGSALIVITPLVAAAWLPSEFPYILRQLLLGVWGVGAILVAERLLFSDTLTESLRAVGFVHAERVTLLLALLGSVPMWAFLPLLASTKGIVVDLRSDW